MHFIPLLGEQLKGDAIVELLEADDVEVIYDFDRSHENLPDAYWAHLRSSGFLFRFDEAQRLKVMFLYFQPIEGFNPVDREAIEDIPLFSKNTEVEKYCAGKGMKYSKGERREKKWVRLETPEHHVHYEFRDGILTLVTLTDVSSR
jgi:hypothetical protein